MTKVVLSNEEKGLLLKPVVGQGGWQSLLRRLQRQLDGSVLSLTPADVQRIGRYRERYGSGGWQGRLAFLRRVSLDSAA
jgi:hypothetical protein